MWVCEWKKNFRCWKLERERERERGNEWTGVGLTTKKTHQARLAQQPKLDSNSLCLTHTHVSRENTSLSDYSKEREREREKESLPLLEFEVGNQMIVKQSSYLDLPTGIYRFGAEGEGHFKINK